MQYLITEEEKKELQDTYARDLLDRDIVIRGIARTLLVRQEQRCRCDTYDQQGGIDKREPVKSCRECYLFKMSKEIENSPFGKSNTVAARDTLIKLCGRGNESGSF